MCDTNSYNRYSPTKQNLLCQRQTPVEVILKSKEFQNGKGSGSSIRRYQFREKASDEQTEFESGEELHDTAAAERESLFDEPVKVFTAPSFRYARSSVGGPKRLILVLDVTKNVGDSETWRKIRDSLYRLINYLSLGTEIAVVTFGSESARVNVPLTQIRDANRQGLHGRIPFRQNEDDRGKVELGIESALSILSEAGFESSAILLVTGSYLGQLVNQDIMDKVTEKVNEESLPVYQVLFNSQSQNFPPKFDALTGYGGKFQLPPAEISSDVLQQLSSIFLAILKSSGGPRIECSYKKFFDMDLKNFPNEALIEGTFFVEEELSSNLMIVLTSQSQEDAEIFEVTSPSGKKFSFPKYEHGIVYFHFEAKNNEHGVWSYSVKLAPLSQSDSEEFKRPGKISVEVFGERSQPHAGAVSLDFWTHQDTDQPIVLYAQLTQDSLPIMDAEITAEASYLNKEGRVRSIMATLKDSGTGYPDITKGDGIYSAYLIHVPKDASSLSFSVRANHNNGQARLPKPFGGSKHDKTGHLCCGSTIPDMFTIPSQPFERYIAATSVTVIPTLNIQVQNSGDAYPPSRISDLALVNYVNDSLDATLSWTAPGGDFNVAKAFRYEIRCYTSPDGLTDEMFHSKGIPVHESLIPFPAESGTRQQAIVSLPWANELFYYTIEAFDESNNRGLVSNLVPIYIIEIATSTSMANIVFKVVNGTDDDAAADLAKHVQQAIDNNTMIYLIAGGITAFLLILISLFVVAICKSKRRRQFLKEIPPPPPISQRGSHSLNDLGQRSQNIYVLNSSSSTTSLPNIASSMIGGLSDQPMSTMTTTSTLPDIAIDKHSSSYDVWNIPAKESNYATMNKLADFTSLFTKRSPPAETDNYVGSYIGFPSLQHISSPRLTATSRQGPMSLISLNAMGLSTYQDQNANHSMLPSSQPNLSHQLPMQVFRSSSLSEDAPSSSAGDHSPTYQNWSGASTVSTSLKTNKSGLATTKRIRGKATLGSDCATSSTECSHSDDGESDQNNGSGKPGKNVYNVSSARITKLASTPPTPAPRTALSSKQSDQEKKKRQESLV